jgi:polyhydroxyalkanoate synthase
MNTETDFYSSMQQYWQFSQDFINNFSQQMTQPTPVQKALFEQQGQDFSTWLETLSQQPETMMKNQSRWWQSQIKIIQQALHSENDNVEPIIKEERGDKRFKDQQWQKNPLFNYIKQSYLLFNQSFLKTIRDTEGLDEKQKERLEFFARQMINSLSPSNFISTNPELLKLTLESKGENLAKGFELFKQDLQNSQDMLRISMTEENAFKLGKDIATTPGRVVFQNHLFELIQYNATTDEVLERPLLIVPPFVNKYYILDLQAKNSLVKWTVDQGHTIFMISWKNPTPSMKEVDFEDYVLDGVVAALEVIEKKTGQGYVNALGYCIGGTLLTTAMAYFAAKRSKQRVKSATLLTTLLDFSQPGELGVFINEPTIAALEAYNNQNGVMNGHSLGASFSMLRENTLYWNYYVNNYLKGQNPLNMDLLYWNGDSSNLTARCHNFMLRSLYLNNQLIEAKSLSIRGTKIDLSKVKQPIYLLSTRDDHIALWQGTFKGVGATSSDVTYVLGESGHIAGVINPPDANKYGYYCGDTFNNDEQAWLAQATHHQGSWWPHWHEWITNHHGKKVPARLSHCQQFPGIYDAPGEYVKEKV